MFYNGMKGGQGGEKDGSKDTLMRSSLNYVTGKANIRPEAKTGVPGKQNCQKRRQYGSKA